MSALRKYEKITDARVLEILGDKDLTVVELSKLLESSYEITLRHLGLMYKAGLVGRWEEPSRYRLTFRYHRLDRSPMIG